MDRNKAIPGRGNSMNKGPEAERSWNRALKLLLAEVEERARENGWVKKGLEGTWEGVSRP